MTTRGWSLFEAIQMCEAMSIDAVITLKSTETYQDLGDLVEYLFAGSESEWGRLRVDDGHPQPYNISWFEIGNEIDTQDFAGRALAMEARAKSIGKGGVLRYACPANCGDSAVINASFAGSPPLGGRVYLDVHDSAKQSLSAARGHAAQFKQAGSLARVVVWETNTARHDFSRVVAEASDINDLQRAGWMDDARVDSRVESFCMEKSGHDPCLDTKHGFCGDQGAVFFAPNQTWAQPPFYVHQMIATTPGQDLLLAATVAGRVNATHPGCKNCKNCDAFPCCGLNILAAKSKDGKTVVVRTVNSGTAAVNVTFDIVNSGGTTAAAAVAAAATSFMVTTLASSTGTLEGPDTDNPIYDPSRHAPVVSARAPFDAAAPQTLPPVSFQIFVFSMA
eukprot:SAG22_NODE_2549_length_2457_cov_1.877014_1_plen_392_part_00